MSKFSDTPSERYYDEAAKMPEPKKDHGKAVGEAVARATLPTQPSIARTTPEPQRPRTTTTVMVGQGMSSSDLVALIIEAQKYHGKPIRIAHVREVSPDRAMIYFETDNERKRL